MTAVRLAALWVAGARMLGGKRGKASTDKPSSESELMSSGLEERISLEDSATKAAIKETSASRHRR